MWGKEGRVFRSGCSGFEILTKGGSLCFYGDWFGRPYDNYHRIKNYSYENNVLTIHFDEGECLSISNPQKMVNDKNGFSVMDASKVEWEHYSYGARVKKNDRKTVYEFVDGKLIKTTEYGSEMIKRKAPYCAVVVTGY